MIDYSVAVIDDVVEGFIRNFTWQVAFSTYWFLFFVEFPRYYILDMLVVGHRKLFYRRYRKKENVARMKLFIENPFVSIIVPGKNEGANVFKLVTSLREQTYSNFEIIIVDDGSDDNTPMICRDLEKNGLIDRYIRMETRGGKASAANAGLNSSKGKYIVHLDADTSLDRDALEKILAPFYYDSQIKAVGGTVKVRNVNDSICASMQALEYLKTIQVGRMVTNTLGLLHIISGAFGAFERKTLEKVGGWDIGPGLDGDVTQKIRKAGYRIYFAEHAVAMTDVPVSWIYLFNQRLRWSKSLVRFRIRKHRNIFFPDKNFSFSNFFSNLDGILYDFVANFVWFFYVIVLIMEHPDRIVEIFAIGYIIRIIFNFLAFGIMVSVSERPAHDFRLIRFVPLSTFYSGYFLRVARLTAYIKEVSFFSSYNDDWNPRKTSDVARAEGM